MEVLKGGITPKTGSATIGREIFDGFVERYTEPLYWHVRRLVGVHEDAQDAVQETFIRAYDKLADFRGTKEQFPAWLYRIATNMAITMLRRRKRHFFSSLDSVGRELRALTADEYLLDADQGLIQFQRAILSLPIKQKAVFNLRYYEQMPYAEIAEILDQKEETLKVNYHLAVKKIKQELTK